MFIYSEEAQRGVYGSFDAYQDLLNKERQLELPVYNVQKEMNKRWR